MTDRLARLTSLRRLDARAADRALAEARAEAARAEATLARVAPLRTSGGGGGPASASAATTGALLASEAHVRTALAAAQVRAAHQLARSQCQLSDAERASRLTRARHDVVQTLRCARDAALARALETRRLEHYSGLARGLLHLGSTPAGARDR